MNKNKLQHHPINHQLQYEYILGPIKIKDGLFMGDELAAKDVEFIISNKVTHIVNTVSKRIPNIWEKIGVQYLSFNWVQTETNIFDKKNITLNTLFNFIEQAMQLGESCLVHSVNGKSRSCVVISAYLMKKYSWSLEKSLQFISNKKQLDIRQGFFYQLKQLQDRLNKIYNFSSSWQDIKNQDDLILRNTYINSKNIQFKQTQNPNKSKKRVTWIDAEGKTPKQKKKLLIKDASEAKEFNQSQLKSILKGSITNTTNPQIPPILKPQQVLLEPKIINNINGNIIHVTVNNFLAQQEPKPPNQSQNKKSNSTTTTTTTNPLLTRPHSSDAKDREKKKEPPKKMIYDTLFNNMKQSPYQTKFVNNTKLGYQRPIKSATTGPTKKQQSNPTKPLAIFERPQSASNTQKKKMKGIQTLKQQLIITNGNKKIFTTGRYPSPMVNKEDSGVIKSLQHKQKYKGL